MKPPTLHFSTFRYLVLLLGLGLGWGCNTPSDVSQSSNTGGTETVKQGRVISLVTGDKITVLSEDLRELNIEPGPGRGDIQFLRKHAPGHVTVIPSDVLPAIRADKLDPRLFNIGLLLKNAEIRNRDTDSIPLIIEYTDTGKNNVTQQARLAPHFGNHTYKQYNTLNMAAVVANSDGALWRAVQPINTQRTSAVPSMAPGIQKIWMDGIRMPALDVSRPLVGASEAQDSGFDGTGIVVAVIDSGVDESHPDLVGRVVNSVSFLSYDSSTLDTDGHGTHVASTIAGSGAASNGVYRGIAPGVQLLSAKVCNFYCEDSAILQGMEWAAEQGANVINMSVGGTDGPEIDPLETAVNTLSVQYDTLFVIAAGNLGGDMTVSSPGSADAALTVAAFDDDNMLASFSSRGPRVGDFAVKPDIAAPGVSIVAAVSKDSGGQGSYVARSGTSMATPHVSGAAAILRQRHPDWPAATIKAALMASASPTAKLGGFAQGAGRVNIVAALEQNIAVSPSSVSCGNQMYPHHDDEPVEQPLLFHNLGNAPVVLELAVQASRDNLPEGLFAVYPSTLTIPPGGSASAVFSCDTRLGGEEYGTMGGILLGTSETDSVSVPFGVLRETESYDLTLVHTTRLGGPATMIESLVISMEEEQVNLNGDWQVSFGDWTFRLPRQLYTSIGVLIEKGVQGNSLFSFFRHEPFELKEDTVLAFDASAATPVKLSVSNENAVLSIQQFSNFHRFNKTSGLFQPYVLYGSDELFVSQIGEGENSHGHWVLSAGWLEYAEDTIEKNYSAIWRGDSKFPHSMDHNLNHSDFVKLQTRYHAQAFETFGLTTMAATWADARSALAPYHAIQSINIPLPSILTNYVHSESEIRWHSFFEEIDIDSWLSVASTSTPSTGYRKKGYHGILDVNKAVIGPRLGRTTQSAEFNTFRQGNDMQLVVGLFSGNSFAHYTARLQKDGVELVAVESDSIIRTVVAEVPPELGYYQLDIEGTRSRPGIVSSRVTSRWTFHSQYFDESTKTQLPLGMMTFAPDVDWQNFARANRRVWVPVSVSDTTGGRWSKPKVDVSYDNGQTWKRAKVYRPWWCSWRSNTWHIKLRHPRVPKDSTDRFVSLRGSSEDSDGNQTQQTILGAYRLRH